MRSVIATTVARRSSPLRRPPRKPARPHLTDDDNERSGGRKTPRHPEPAQRGEGSPNTRPSHFRDPSASSRLRMTKELFASATRATISSFPPPPPPAASR